MSAGYTIQYRNGLIAAMYAVPNAPHGFTYTAVRPSKRPSPRSTQPRCATPWIVSFETSAEGLVASGDREPAGAVDRRRDLAQAEPRAEAVALALRRPRGTDRGAARRLGADGRRRRDRAGRGRARGRPRQAPAPVRAGLQLARPAACGAGAAGLGAARRRRGGAAPPGRQPAHGVPAHAVRADLLRRGRRRGAQHPRLLAVHRQQLHRRGASGPQPLAGSAAGARPAVAECWG